MKDRRVSEERRVEEYASLFAQSVSAIRGRLDARQTQEPDILVRNPIGNGNIAYTDSRQGEITRFSIYDSVFRRTVYNFMPDGNVVKTGMVIDVTHGVSTVYHPLDGQDEPLRIGPDSLEVTKDALPVGLDELRKVAKVVGDPEENAGLIASLPRLQEARMRHFLQRLQPWSKPH